MIPRFTSLQQFTLGFPHSPLFPSNWVFTTTSLTNATYTDLTNRVVLQYLILTLSSANLDTFQLKISRKFLINANVNDMNI